MNPDVVFQAAIDEVDALRSALAATVCELADSLTEVERLRTESEYRLLRLERRDGDRRKPESDLGWPMLARRSGERRGHQPSLFVCDWSMR